MNSEFDYARLYTMLKKRIEAAWVKAFAETAKRNNEAQKEAA